MIHHLTGGAWGFLIGRIVEAQMKTLPLVAFLFVPVAIGLPYAYAWAGNRSIRANRATRLGATIWNRNISCSVQVPMLFAAWLVLMVLMAAWSRRQDEASNVALVLEVVQSRVAQVCSCSA